MQICLAVGLELLAGLVDGGDIVVDDHGDGLDIDTSGENVGCDEDFGLAVAELVDDFVAGGAVDAAGEGGADVAVCCHAAFDFSGGFTGLW